MVRRVFFRPGFNPSILGYSSLVYHSDRLYTHRMLKSFVYRLYPSKIQRSRLESVRETCRRFYNTCLAERKDAYDQRGETITKFAQLRKVKQLKATNPVAADVHSHILQVVVADLDKAFQAFFRRVQAGEKPGYPRFKGQNRFAGFGFKEYGNGFKIDGRRLKLSGIGRIVVRWHRPIEGTIKTARIVRRAGKWFVAFACAVEKPAPLPKTGQEVGIDLGLRRLATLSTGEKIENPRWYRSILGAVRITGRRVSRRTLGGSNRRKAVRQLQCLLLRVANTRKDFLNKSSNKRDKKPQFVTKYQNVTAYKSHPGSAVPGLHLASSLLHLLTAFLRSMASTDRGIRTPTSGGGPLIEPAAVQPLDQPQEHPLPGIPRQ